MVAREGRVGIRCGDEDHPVGIGDVRPRSLPEVTDDLADEQRQTGGRERRRRREPPAQRSTRPIAEPEPERGNGEHDRADGHEDLDGVLIAIPRHEAVQVVEDRPVHRLSVVIL